MSNDSLPEPWLRGTLSDIPAVQRATLHALELAREDLVKWCGPLSDEQLNANPGELPSVAYHLRHIAGSLDRLLTYAEGKALSEEQLVALGVEMDTVRQDEVLAELSACFSTAYLRIKSFNPRQLEERRFVGKKRVPTTLGGLLVHIADHTQRHVGQAITTARIVLSDAF